MDTVSAAQELRNLLISHDKAQLEIQSLDVLLHRLTGNVTSQAPSGRIIGGMQIMQRTGVIKAVKEMYIVYRCRKWQQIQTLVHIIMDNLGQQSEEMPDDDIHSNHEVIVIAKAMCLDFCELNRFE